MLLGLNGFIYCIFLSKGLSLQRRHNFLYGGWGEICTFPWRVGLQRNLKTSLKGQEGRGVALHLGVPWAA